MRTEFGRLIHAALLGVASLTSALQAQEVYLGCPMQGNAVERSVRALNLLTRVVPRVRVADDPVVRMGWRGARRVTLAELRARWEARARDAEAMHASAPVADVLRVALSELEAADGARGPPATDRLLTAEEAAPRLGATVRWLYDQAKTLPFTKRLSRKCLRFSEMGLRRCQQRRSAA